jgi:hypothetical protein
MMKKITLLTIALTFFLAGELFSQEEKKSTSNIPSIGAHVGTLSYLGDIEGGKGSSLYTYWRPAYGFYLEKKFGSIIGLTVNGMFGKISKSQLDDDVFLNFESAIFNTDLNILFDFDNGKIIKGSSLFSPYISVGFGYMTFDPKGDLSADGNTYFHWSDGTLRDIDESTPGGDTTSTIITRDYDYESSLKDTLKDYAKNTFTIPLRFGLKFKLSKNIDARLSAAYILTMTDYLDNYADGGNDNLFYTSFGLQYNFTKSSPEDNKYKDFDFSDLDKDDSDGDGIFDMKDMCQNTPENVKVDAKGCALDGDKDGVPDYKDKELNTPEGTIVNADGATLTDEMIAERNQVKDSVEVKYRIFKADDLTKKELEEIQKQYENSNKTSIKKSTIPEKFAGLDQNNDNYISAKEVTNGIDGFFEGENNLSAKDLNELIDFYFDQ